MEVQREVTSEQEIPERKVGNKKATRERPSSVGTEAKLVHVGVHDSLRSRQVSVSRFDGSAPMGRSGSRCTAACTRDNGTSRKKENRANRVRPIDPIEHVEDLQEYAGQ